MINKLEMRHEEHDFASGFQHGRCPRCGKMDAHDCKAVHYVLNHHTSPKEIIMEWSSCEVALEINDISVAHCDNCNYVWCLECLSPMAADEGICLHWEICALCNEEEGLGVVEGCDEMHDIECQYRDKSKCPKIRSMKRENDTEIEEATINKMELIR